MKSDLLYRVYKESRSEINFECIPEISFRKSKTNSSAWIFFLFFDFIDLYKSFRELTLLF